MPLAGTETRWNLDRYNYTVDTILCPLRGRKLCGARSRTYLHGDTILCPLRGRKPATITVKNGGSPTQSYAPCGDGNSHVCGLWHPLQDTILCPLRGRKLHLGRRGGRLYDRHNLMPLAGTETLAYWSTYPSSRRHNLMPLAGTETKCVKGVTDASGGTQSYAPCGDGNKAKWTERL